MSFASQVDFSQTSVVVHPARNQTLSRAGFAPGYVVVLDGHQPACVLRLARHKSRSGLKSNSSSDAPLAPFDVRLFEKEGDTPENVHTVVQPDLMVVCDRSKVDWRGIHGAPDMVVEILSDSTSRLDRGVKLGLYQRAGVREYWMVDPQYRSISVYRQDDDVYQMRIYLPDADIPVGILEGCTVNLGAIFSET